MTSRRFTLRPHLPHRPGHLLLIVGVLAALAIPAFAADVLEPWSPGLSNVELFATYGSGLDGADTTAALGTGLPGGFSLGVTLTHSDAGATEAGVILVWTRSLGELGELDLYGEYLPVGGEVELLGATRLFGVEWSGSAGRAVPYARLSLSDDGEVRSLHPLLGWMLPLRSGVELHLEVSSEEAESGTWPLHVAVGPNWQLADGIELLPELSVVWHPDGGGGERGTEVFFTLGFCIDPTALGGGTAID